MRKVKHVKFMQFAALCLAICLAVGFAPARAATVTIDPTLRVGLFYGGNALPGANLLNEVGSGYRLGYFDSNLNFQQLGYTSQTAISVVKTQNVYYAKSGSWWGYYDTLTSDIAVGCWHLQLPEVYGDYQQAVTAASGVQGGFPAWIDGSYYVRVGAYLDKDSALAAQTALGLTAATVVGTSSAGVSVVVTGTSTVIFQFDSTAGLSLAVKPGLDESVKTETIFRGNTYYGSFEYQRTGGGNLTVVNVVGLEDYVQGVIIHEMNASWPLEALKAQAVCARTYAYRSLISSKHASQGFNLCNTNDCQVYSGIASASDNSRRAVEETRGEYAFYNGSLAETVYFSSDGGATESAVNVWGSDVPYLVGKEDPYEAAVAGKIDNYNWTVTFTAQELTDLLNSSGMLNSGIVDLQVTRTTPTGNVLEITFTDSSGKSWSKIKESCRTFLGLRSQRYTISSGGGTSSGTSAGYAVTGGGTLTSMDGVYAVDGTGETAALSASGLYVATGSGTEQLGSASSSGGSGTFVITGSGWGHSVGMSQWGAYSMAQSGYTYDQILTFYYTGIEVRQP